MPGSQFVYGRRIIWVIRITLERDALHSTRLLQADFEPLLGLAIGVETSTGPGSVTSEAIMRHVVIVEGGRGGKMGITRVSAVVAVVRTCGVR